MTVETTENTYQVGDVAHLTARFQDPVTLAYVQPTMIACQVMDPNGTVTTPAPAWNPNLATPDGVVGGGFYVDQALTLPGTWYYRFSSTGVYQAADWRKLYVERSPFP